MRYSRIEKTFRMILSVCLLTGFSSCSDNPADSNDTPPQIPSPQTTMLIDVSAFTLNPSKTARIDDRIVNTKQNFLTAAAVVTVFNTTVLLGISVPAAAAAAALSVEPTFESDNKFHWRFTFSENGLNLSLELTAEVNRETVAWEMFVTGNFPTPLEHFLWYDGESQRDGASGHWQFYNPQKPNEKDGIARIDWTFVSEKDRTLIFLNDNDESDGFGDTLTYTVKDDDVKMIFVKASTQETIEVALDAGTKEGHIIAPSYKEGQKSCWDRNLDDAECP